MIMTFKPTNTDAIAEQMDINTLSTKSMTPAFSKIKSTLKQLRTSSGTSKSGLALPEAAPLMYPGS